MSSYASNPDSASLRLLAERLRLAERVGKIGIWEWDIAASHLTWSEEVYRIHGKEPDYIPEYESWQQTIHQEDRERVLHSIGETMQTGREYYVDFRVVWPDGSVRWITTRGGVEYDAEHRPARMIGLTFDITDRKLAEEALLRKEQELRVITDALPLQIAYIDSDRRYRFVNRAYESWAVRPKQEIIGQPMSDILGKHNYNKVLPYVHRALSGQSAFFETELLPMNGQPLQVQVSYIPDRNTTGEVQGFYAMVQDVTVERRAEHALRRAEKLAAAGRLAATIAHELNNPLEAITNLVFLAMGDPAAPPEMHHYLTLAEQELRRVHHLVNQTLGFYRDLSRPTDVDFQKLVENVLSVHARKAEAREVKVRTSVEPAATMHAVAGELTQVLSNLLSNALDAVGPGGQVRLDVRARGNTVRLIVADNGCGIPGHDRSRLFEPFFSTKIDVGTGLGLWVTKGIVEKHQGTIRLRSRNGGPYRGTLFAISFPRSTAALPPDITEGQRLADSKELLEKDKVESKKAASF